MSSDKNFDLPRYCTDVAQRAAIAARAMATVCGETKNRFLLAAAEALCADQERILRANQTDLDAAPEFGMSASQIDRLRLSPARLRDMSQALREIALLPDPVGQTIGATIRPNGLEVAKVRVPLGVVFFIYESRPNVTVDAAAICMKSGNAVILRGGKEASHSSAALVACLREAAQPLGLPPDAVQLVSTADREAVAVDLHPPAADQRQSGRPRQQRRDLGGGQRLAADRHLDAEVEQSVEPEAGGGRAADGRRDLGPRRPLPAPRGRHADDHAGALERRDVAEEREGILW